MFNNIRDIESKHVVVMHDFFVDRIVMINDLNSLFSEVKAKSKIGGGSIRDVPQKEMIGGNAINIAYALAKVGAKVCVITIADNSGKNILQNMFAKYKNVKFLITDGKPGNTVSFEIERKDKRKANVMISDVGDMKNFGVKELRKNEMNMIRKASAVVIANWASNIKGTELALKAFKNTPKDALCFMDPADISTRKKDFRHCLDELSGHMNVLSLNENECRLTMESLGLLPLPINYSNKDITAAAKALSSKLSVNVDIHTPIGSSTSNGVETSFVKSLEFDTVVSTGAGDVWDAADIIGYLCGLQASERLLFANVCAAYYISRIEPPTLQEVSKFFNNIQSQ